MPSLVDKLCNIYHNNHGYYGSGSGLSLTNFLWPQTQIVHLSNTPSICFICDRICKNRSKSHRNWNRFYCWTLKLTSCTNQKCLTHGYRWPSTLSQTAFFHPCQTIMVTAANNSRLIQWIESVSVTYWRHSTAVCVFMEGLIHLRLPTHPLHPPHPSHPSTPYNMPSVILQSLWKKLLKIQQC